MCSGEFACACCALSSASKSCAGARIGSAPGGSAEEEAFGVMYEDTDADADDAEDEASGAKTAGAGATANTVAST